MRRREFLQRATEAAGALAFLGCSAGNFADAPGDGSVVGGTAQPRGRAALPIVDTHQHLWDLKRLRLSWVGSSTVLNRSFLVEDYVEATSGLNVVKAVYMEVAAEPEQQLDEAQSVLELCRRGGTPTCAAVIGGRPGSEGFREYIGRFAGDRHVKGVRQVLYSSPDLCAKEEFVRGIRLLGDLGMSFDLCMSPGDLRLGIQLVERCPGTRIVVDHCGGADPGAFRRGSGGDERPPAEGEAPAAASERARGDRVSVRPDDRRPSHDPDQWRRDMDTLSRSANTVCKISGIVARARPVNWTPQDLAPVVRHSIDAFGPDRVLFGSDWPVCTTVATVRQWVEALGEIVKDRSLEERRKLFHDNAVRFYDLR